MAEENTAMNPLHAKQQHSEDELNQRTSSSASSNRDNGENMEQADVQISPTDTDSAEKRMAPPTEGPSCPVEDNKLNVEKNSTPPQADDRSCGDNNNVGTPRNEEPRETAGEVSRDDHTGEETAPEATTSPTLDDTKDDQIDGPQARLNEEATDTNTEAREDDGRRPENCLPEEEKDIQGSTTLPQSPEEISDKGELPGQRKHVETIGPTAQETTEHSLPEVTGIRGGSGIYLIAVCIVGLAMLVPHLFQPESPPQQNLQQIDIFLRQMEKVKSQFPNQRPELWKRSRIHLERHLNTTQPTEPVSLILTAGLRAERTLHCLAQGLASTFSSALNASVLYIDGASKASQDSDQVKLDIDSQLQGAFEGDKPVAVIHRFEELPPGSTLIFYRYCDHENAAYKKTFLIFTVLLGEEEEIPAKIRLSTVEEMVDDHLQKKFLSHGNPVAFDRMDLDKYGGLWSRISHLILPVAAEKRIEHGGC